jgi:hypothetical protein
MNAKYSFMEAAPLIGFIEEHKKDIIGKPICKVADITIERFSEEFEINGTTGETRPNGGDYFKTITVHIENGSRFYICGRDARDDGYLDVWDDSSRIF